MEDLDNSDALDFCSTIQAKREPYLCDARELAVALNLIWEQNAYTTLPDKGKGDPQADSLSMSVLNTVALLNIPITTKSILNPTIPSKDAVHQNSGESCSSDPLAPDDMQALNALPVGTSIGSSQY